MSYLVLARRYRPERFADMIGQEHVCRTLQNAIANDRLHHAYLFTGVRGLGKTTAARILAKALVCERGPAAEPCNECAQCTAVREGRSVDVIEIDGASNNSVDDIRALREQVHYLPAHARRKIYIIDEVHMLSASAFNALLKTLEEPPAHVTFLFATTDPQKVLPTILSRVSRLDLRRVASGPLIAHLQRILAAEGVRMGDAGLALVARAGDGSVRDSLTHLDKILAFASDPHHVTDDEVRELLGYAEAHAIFGLVDAILRRDAQAVLERFDEVAARSADLVRVGLSILQHLRDLGVIASTATPEAARRLLDVPSASFDDLVEQSRRADLAHLLQLFDRLARALGAIEHSRAPRLALEMTLVDLARQEPLVALADTIARLDALAGGGTSEAGGATPPRGGAARSGGRAGAASGPRAAPPTGAPPRRSDAVGPVDRAEPRPALGGPRDAAPGARGEDVGLTDFGRQLLELAGHVGGGQREPSGRDGDTRALPVHGLEPSAPAFDPTPRTPAQASRAPEPRAQAPASAPALERSTQAASPPARRVIPSADIADPAQASIDDLDGVLDATWSSWEFFLVALRDRHPALFELLAMLGVAQLAAPELILAAPPAATSRQLLSTAGELSAALSAALAQDLGVERLRWLDAEPALRERPSLTLVQAARIERQRQRAHDRAHADARLGALVERFDARIDHVEPLDVRE